MTVGTGLKKSKLSSIRIANTRTGLKIRVNAANKTSVAVVM